MNKFLLSCLLLFISISHFSIAQSTSYCSSKESRKIIDEILNNGIYRNIIDFPYLDSLTQVGFEKLKLVKHPIVLKTYTIKQEKTIDNLNFEQHFDCFFSLNPFIFSYLVFEKSSNGEFIDLGSYTLEKDSIYIYNNFSIDLNKKLAINSALKNQKGLLVWILINKNTIDLALVTNNVLSYSILPDDNINKFKNQEEKINILNWYYTKK